MEIFEIEEYIIHERNSGMRLKLVPDKKISDDIVWISGLFIVPGGPVEQNFVIMNCGRPTYQLVNKAMIFWGKTVLKVDTHSAMHMSSAFGSEILIPSVMNIYEAPNNL